MKSPLKVIRGFCKECIYDPKDKGTDVFQIENCTFEKCPLFEYRPLTASTKRKLKEIRIKSMSEEEKARYQEKQKVARERFEKYRK